MSTKDTEDATARRLIETALGTEEQFGEYVERARASSEAFRAAADAYATSNLFGASVALASYAADTASTTQAGYDLCASGASLTAGLIVSLPSLCGHPECAGGIRLDDSADPATAVGAAIRCVNAVADGEPEHVAAILHEVYRADGPDGLRTVAVALVDAYAHITQITDGITRP